MDVTITLTVNGKKRTITTDPERSLLDVLREDLRLTGTKYGCGEGLCGACTVLVDGNLVLSCVTPVGELDKKAITTIEGLATGDSLHPVQEAFLAEDAVQCGYCAPGMIMTAAALLKKNPHPTDKEIIEWMNGNLVSVALSDGTQIEYIVDGMNRRIGKKVNRLLVQGFLYRNPLSPIGEPDIHLLHVGST